MTAKQQKKWLNEQFEFEYCSECFGDAEDHMVMSGPFGLPFAMCKFAPIQDGYALRNGALIQIDA